MIRAALDRAVVVLLALAVMGGAGLWRLVSWSIEADELAMSGSITAEEQMQLQLMWMLPFMLGPAATTLLLGALIGLPLVVGARYAAIARAPSVGPEDDPAAIPEPGVERVG
jgi:hypothetical protein